MVVAGGGVLAVALLGIGGWYVAHTKSTESELNSAISNYEARNQLVDVTFNVDVPANTPKEQLLYLSGSVPAMGNWDAAGVPLERGADGKFTATVKGLQNTGEYKFKVTRGTWGTVETTLEGRDVDDRVFVAAKNAKVDATVQEWRDHGQATPGRVTMTGNVIVHKNALNSKLLGNARTVVVYLPPDYDKNKETRYPVLYMQDGQNLFDQATSYQGIEWGLDEAAQKLITGGKIKPAIIVGIFNSEQRTPEFTPPFAATPPAATGPASSKEPPRGDAYARMLVTEAKPFIDKAYRTAPERENTIIGGGSMGALIALYAARQHNDVFGQVVALSPWLRAGAKGEKEIIADLVGDGTWLKKTRLYLDMGTDPGHNYPGGAAGADKAVPDAEALVAAVERAGVGQGEQFTYREVEGGTHNEAAWAATAEQVLLAVLGVPQPATTAPAASQPVTASSAGTPG
jgi:predicted alpha/beta superfamily hydrolase